jgi:hypothetical protein
MSTYTTEFVQKTLNSIRRGLAVLAGIGARQQTGMYPVPARAKRQITWRSTVPQTGSRRPDDLDSMSSGCIVYHRPRRMIGEE